MASEIATPCLPSHPSAAYPLIKLPQAPKQWERPNFDLSCAVFAVPPNEPLYVSTTQMRDRLWVDHLQFVHHRRIWNDRVNRIFKIIDEAVEFIAFHRRTRRPTLKLTGARLLARPC